MQCESKENLFLPFPPLYSRVKAIHIENYDRIRISELKGILEFIWTGGFQAMRHIVLGLLLLLLLLFYVDHF